MPMLRESLPARSVGRLGIGQRVTSWQHALILNNSHPRYANGLIALLSPATKRSNGESVEISVLSYLAGRAQSMSNLFEARRQPILKRAW
jgi:hypothetical protein